MYIDGKTLGQLHMMLESEYIKMIGDGFEGFTYLPNISS